MHYIERAQIDENEEIKKLVKNEQTEIEKIKHSIELSGYDKDKYTSNIQSQVNDLSLK